MSTNATNTLTAAICYERRGKIGLISINNPPINAISAAVREGLISALTRAKADKVSSVLIYCMGKTFIAGADITEFGKPQTGPTLPEVISAIEEFPVPVIAALHGNALGGGLEIAMAAHYRCAAQNTKLGLPEVTLGLVPGSGGTQRLPRLIGVEKALAMISSGKAISADEALQCGLIDQIIAASLPESGIAYAKELIDNGAKVRPTSALIASPVDEHFFENKKNSLKPTGILAPAYILELIELATKTDIHEGQRVERERFLECRSSAGSAALRHIFLAERACTKLPDIAPSVTPRPINKVAVIGAGTMGGGIAMCFASAGFPVTLIETAQENLNRGLDQIEANYNQSVKRGRLSQDQLAKAISNIKPSLQYADIADADLVIEATFENMDVKKAVFSKLVEVCKPNCILATNTSYLDVNTIADVTGRPQDVIGAHFFSPANIMKLLEVVRTQKTAPEVVMSVMVIAKRIGKVAVAVGVCHGFVGNRMFKAYARQAQLLLLEGCTPAQVDTVIQTWGMAMGPLAVGDLAGIDISYRSRRDQGICSGSIAEFALPDLLVEMGRLGQKSGSGYYNYEPETRARKNDQSVHDLIQSIANQWCITRREISNDEIIDRLSLALINEGAHILDEGIAARPSDIDVVYVNGYGFPRWRGGPMYLADKIGLDKVVRKLEILREQTGDTCWEPAKLLHKLAATSQTLSSLNN
ncbi:3-hydroxyacyl-CoA dehydrogenase NAD-binding protein [gamma proteobacterium BDW918]|uniref:3-hydroxyacyl-CoA dehydrogenase n=1 Tax=Zhongshania aliphaticivorans TaxID=1470434 RepID=A0A127M243_9GAMM|nr:3-hydroxyacyl-CoA dehydrogenase NAD-binding domain-containing protein [Zhongshania aliphaticivorans]AMO67302.1 3-hydroxyacyl-CoA dehydrogenase [Zhongshania aliphaticivorans]EIF44108.1 3-hydroxyacyl-CoA dehydrogenase NAD-binding protein [gamma proteobacterium BDW918]